MKPITILITGAGAPGAPGIIKSLRAVEERPLTIVGVDMSEDVVGRSLVDRFYQVPPANDYRFIQSIFRIARREKVEVILPLVTRELPLFAMHKRKLERAGIRVSVSSLRALSTANNKYFLMKACAEHGIPTPAFRLVRNFKEFEKAVYAFGYPKQPVCFKPPISNGMRGFRILDARIDRAHLLLNEKPNDVVTTFEDVAPVLQGTHPSPPLLVMEYLPGEEYSVDVLAERGRPLIVVPRRRDKIKMGISFVGTTVEHKAMIQNSKKIVSLFKLNGNIGFQFKCDKIGNPKIIESNPRLQGTIALATAAGVNLVYLAVKVALHEPYHIPKIQWGTKMVRYWEEIYYDQRGQTFTF